MKEQRAEGSFCGVGDKHQLHMILRLWQIGLGYKGHISDNLAALVEIQLLRSVNPEIIGSIMRLVVINPNLPEIGAVGIGRTA